uniref:Uncharacterized protein n=1 Tax=Erwinia amylovora ATCC BAA-2158 TaxID=889211 RepID=E5B1Z0_ERWAM|nr:hypothetical protein predicted by Glimmer/Critica [Erwinia amylovora ATCC BAA-2158]
MPINHKVNGVEPGLSQNKPALHPQFFSLAKR